MSKSMQEFLFMCCYHQSNDLKLLRSGSDSRETDRKESELIKRIRVWKSIEYRFNKIYHLGNINQSYYSIAKHLNCNDDTLIFIKILKIDIQFKYIIRYFHEWKKACKRFFNDAYRRISKHNVTTARNGGHHVFAPRKISLI